MKLQRLHKISRREAMMLISGIAGSVIFPSLSFSQTNQALKRIDEITKGLGAEESDIYLDLPEIAENGNAVPLEVSAPGASSITLFADGNPEPVTATFNFGPLSPTSSASTRVRLAKTQNVVALAKMADGSWQIARAAVKVTIGGCGG